MEQVICLHGLGRTRHCWWLLRRRLERAGYRTTAWTYPSFGRSIEQLGQDCRRRLAALAADPAVRRVHVVTHSLGGIVLRSALASAEGGTHGSAQCGEREAMQVGEASTRRCEPWEGSAPAASQACETASAVSDWKLGTVVMLAPPNCGSVWARRLGPWLRWLAPALPQLSDAPDSFVNGLGPVPAVSGEDGTRFVRVAVIAAAKDGKCPVATTHLAGQAAHLVVPGGHTFIMCRQDVARAILGLLGGDQPFNA